MQHANACACACTCAHTYARPSTQASTHERDKAHHTHTRAQLARTHPPGRSVVARSSTELRVVTRV
eukprot:5750824-Pleurochrysis_carterae.AAC.2